jgi:Transposase DDE domain group 1
MHPAGALECFWGLQTFTNEVRPVITQGVLPIKYELEKSQAGMTALGGLPLYLDLAAVMGLSKSIERHVKVRIGEQGWTDVQMVIALVLLNLAGGEHVEDLSRLEGDEGFCRVLRRVEMAGLRRKVRRALERRWRKERKRAVPSPSAVFRYLAAFHDRQQEKLRQAGKAFIPAPNAHLEGLVKVNQELVGWVQKQNPEKTATLDMDATLVETQKSEALYCYQHFKAYQPLNTYWAEQGLVLDSEFRDGNVPAGYQQLRVLEEALALLPEGVEQVRLRSDTAGYQQELLRYCARGENSRFDRIEFAISCDVTPEFKRAVAEVEEGEWKPLYREQNGEQVQTGQQWAEVCFVPNWIGHSKRGPEYRYLAIREPLAQLELPGMEGQRELPFASLEMNRQNYKLLGVVTNMDWEGGRLIDWQHERCGKSEEAHKVMKEDLAGGQLPSGDFGENAAWWWIMVLALNLNVALKRLVLGRGWESKRMKAIRFGLIHLPGRILSRCRQLIVRLGKHCSAYALLIEARQKIAQWAPGPSG